VVIGEQLTWIWRFIFYPVNLEFVGERLRAHISFGARRAMKTAVIVTSYRWPKALDLVLQSLALQRNQANQIIVADDGSSDSVRKVMRRWGGLLPLRLVWEPDVAFRAARVRNLAISCAKCDHLIFTDGDCLLPPDFVREHQRLIQQNHIVAGGRYLLSSVVTRDLIEAGVISAIDTFDVLKFRKLPLGILRDLKGRAWQRVRTCNMGVMRSDILSVGGFDESFEGWGREDSDMVVRMLNNGMMIRSARFAACVAHLHHDEVSRDGLAENDERFSKILQDRVTIFPRKSCVLSI